jgi:hypothetical protein
MDWTGVVFFRMKPTGWLLVIGLIVSATATAQYKPVHLHLQKNGKIKKRFELGSTLQLQDKNGDWHTGMISFMKTDTLILNGNDILALRDIRKFRILHQKIRRPISTEELAWVTLGVGLSTAGMALSKWESWSSALGISAILGIHLT